MNEILWWSLTIIATFFAIIICIIALYIVAVFIVMLYSLVKVLISKIYN